MRGLVVDESSSMRIILKRALEERGFQVMTAASATAALAMLAGDHFDLALIDWSLPGMCGFELVQNIRSQTACQTIKLIMITPPADEGEMVHALAGGADEYLVRPFAPEAVYDRLRLLGFEVPDIEMVPCA